MPVLFLEKSLRPDSGGRGKHRGGLGQTVAFQMVGREAVNMSLLSEKTRTQAQGVCGGEAGASGGIEIHPPRRIAPKGLTKLYPGETLTLHLPGGGGYGDSRERDPEAARRDVEMGYVSAL